jgi:hypothetical protein
VRFKEQRNKKAEKNPTQGKTHNREKNKDGRRSLVQTSSLQPTSSSRPGKPFFFSSRFAK